MSNTVKIVPDWVALVRMMLLAYTNMAASGSDELYDLEKEFVRMAYAADQWNKHVEAESIEEEG